MTVDATLDSVPCPCFVVYADGEKLMNRHILLTLWLAIVARPWHTIKGKPCGWLYINVVIASGSKSMNRLAAGRTFAAQALLFDRGIS